jgi:uncharacterized protein involved in exopolysaccharide biosynthesis
MEDKDVIINVLKQQRNQALDALADAGLQLTKLSQQVQAQAQQIDALRKEGADA